MAQGTTGLHINNIQRMKNLIITPVISSVDGVVAKTMLENCCESSAERKVRVQRKPKTKKTKSRSILSPRTQRVRRKLAIGYTLN